MDTVYIETTVVGHLVGRMHPDPIIAARQTATLAWWTVQAQRFRVFVSRVVLDECGAGDPVAAEERLRVIETITVLEHSPAVDSLANNLMARNAIPASEPQDAAHVAIAALHGVDYLLTWNFKHIANAGARSRIERVCRDAGFEPPTICTPEELLLEANDG